MNRVIERIKIAENTAIVDELVGELHLSEKELNPNTADWNQIRKNYLRFMQDCEEENQGSFFVARCSNKAVGFIFGYIDEKDDSNFELGNLNDLYVSEGYVKKAYRRLGIYTALNNAFEAYYSNYAIRRICRFTLCNNAPMKKWLEIQGYKPTRLLYEKWIEVKN